MSVQVSLNIATYKLIKDGIAYAKTNETLAQDAGRATDLLVNTLMAYNPTTKKWEPFTDETATDGTGYPRGIILETVAAADIVAGDVADLPILVGGGCRVDESMIVIENSKTLETVINVPAGVNVSVEDYLRALGIFTIPTVDIDEYENA